VETICFQTWPDDLGRRDLPGGDQPRAGRRAHAHHQVVAGGDRLGDLAPGVDRARYRA
jgi:hypothetical protein